MEIRTHFGGVTVSNGRDVGTYRFSWEVKMCVITRKHRRARAHAHTRAHAHKHTLLSLISVVVSCVVRHKSWQLTARVSPLFYTRPPHNPPPPPPPDWLRSTLVNDTGTHSNKRLTSLQRVKRLRVGEKRLTKTHSWLDSLHRSPEGLQLSMCSIAGRLQS